MTTDQGSLRLLAQDAEDLAVISAALQDAVGLVGDIAFDAKAQRLTLALNRFRWENGVRAKERVRTGLQFGSVLSVQTKNLRRDAKDAVVELLAVQFEPGEAPGGVVHLVFAGGGDLRARVECIDVVTADLTVPWPTPRRPDHKA
jgi:hypothetical protein